MMFLCSGPSDNQNGKECSKKNQYVVALAATFTLFNAGLHVGWPSPSIPKILSSEFPFDVSPDEASTILVVGFLGDIIGGILSPVMFDRMGRKGTMMLASVPQLLSFCLIYFSLQSKELLYVGRILGGIAEGALFSLCAIYISETVDPDIRGRMGCIGTVLVQLAMIFMNVIGTYLSLSTTALVCVVPPIIFMLVFSRMPETPYYLLMKGKPAEAEKVLRYLLNKEKVEKELTLLTQDVTRQMSESGSFKDLFSVKSNRKALFYAITCRTIQQYSGCTAFGLYTQLLVKNSLSFVSPLVGSTLIFAVQTLMVVFSLVFIDKSGRKPLGIFSTAGCFIFLLANGIYFTIRDYTVLEVRNYEFLPLIFIIGYQVLFSVGIQSLVNIITSEILSAAVKAKALTILNVVFAVTALSSLKYYQFMSDNFGMAIPFYTFAVITFFGVLFFIFIMPETKGKRLEQIQQELKGNKCDMRENT